jgi:hypothetical protein
MAFLVQGGQHWGLKQQHAMVQTIPVGFGMCYLLLVDSSVMGPFNFSFWVSLAQL